MNKHQEQVMRVGETVIHVDDLEKRVQVRMADLRNAARDLRILADCTDPDDADSCFTQSGQDWHLSHPDAGNRAYVVSDVVTPGEVVTIIKEITDLQFKIENAKSGLRTELSYRYRESQGEES